MKTLRYKYRIYPNQYQEEQLRSFCGAQRFVWNFFLSKEQELYEKSGKFSFYFNNNKILTSLKKEEQYKWLKEIPSTSLQQTLLQLDRALKQSFSKNKNRKGFPKFKKKKFWQGSFSLVMVSDQHLSENHIKVPKIGNIRIKLHRKLPSDFKSYNITEKANKWFLSFIVNKDEKEKIKDIKKCTGYDFNSKHIVVSSNAEFIDNPKFFAKTKKKLAKIQRKFSKKKKGSSNWKKELLKVQRCYDKMMNQRMDFLNKLSIEIVKNNDLVCLENLSVKNMQKFNGSMVHDAGWSMLRSMIEFKAEMEGKHVSVIDRFFPSSKLCHNCGTIHNDLQLNNRTFKCDCGREIHRDVNAAINILLEGHRIIGEELTEFTLVDNPLMENTHSENSSDDWLKQEAPKALA